MQGQNQKTLCINRSSNGELLRMICMFMIILHHMIAHVMYAPHILQFDMPTSWDNSLVLFTHGFFYIGVNCFILLSGFYGIKPSFRGFLNLFLTFSFYSALIAIQDLSYVNYSIMHDIVYIIIHALDPFSNCREAWFMQCYMVLYVISPFLNEGIKRFSQKQMLFMVIALSIINIYFGYIQGLQLINDCGYTIMQFIYLYIIGAYIRNFVAHRDNYISAKYRPYAFLLYVFSAFLWAGAVYITLFKNDIRCLQWFCWKQFCYNDPFLLSSSLAFFVFVLTFNFYNKHVNWLAMSCLGVYLGQTLVLRNHLFVSFCQHYAPSTTPPPCTRLFITFVISLAIWIGFLLADKLRYVITKPLSTKIQDFWNHYVRCGDFESLH